MVIRIIVLITKTVFYQLLYATDYNNYSSDVINIILNEKIIIIVELFI
ncbi:hypothetical protein A0H76_3058 [Hepatospora eriocheir]|uniref:Uncharacterized protein n=1 Tax=Hepatospora eriocheir TaxID=1081669 RepID=A0A1X0QAZ6_9MICR|nr:hypothetical protein HERIO_2769 [Hepatospora eriocheir]ORD96946.1 hypothetical protein A0H76_3058 [Hepatospora eriocheir]